MNGRRRRAVAVIAFSVGVLSIAGVLYLAPSIHLTPPATPVAPAPPLITVPGESVTFDFIAPSTGWAAVTLDGDDRIWIFQTTDGARSWRLNATLAMTQQMAGRPQLRFFDGRSGVLSVYVQTGVLGFRSADGGHAWKGIDLVPDTWAIGFTDPEHGWSTTVDSASGRTHLFVTDDRGDAWSSVPDPPAPGYPDFANAGEGWLGGPASTRTVYTTETGGRTWEAWRLPEAPPCTPFGKSCGYGNGSDLVIVDALAGSGAIATDGDGAEFVTLDGGTTWRFLEPPPPAGVYDDISRLDQVHWWVVRGNDLYKTADAGATWNRVSSRVEYDSLHPVILDAQDAWAMVQAADDSHLGQRPRIGWSLVVTSDGGLSWKDATVPVPG